MPPLFPGGWWTGGELLHAHLLLFFVCIPVMCRLYGHIVLILCRSISNLNFSLRLVLAGKTFYRCTQYEYAYSDTCTCRFFLIDLPAFYRYMHV